jgi:hypothetical protein
MSKNLRISGLLAPLPEITVRIQYYEICIDRIASVPKNSPFAEAACISVAGCSTFIQWWKRRRYA